MRHVLLFDGTWRKYEDQTNIARMLDFIQDSPDQVTLYFSGVSSTSHGDKLLTGITGLGVEEDLCYAYQHLVLNWNPGDELFLFGFSRGAFIARSLAGMLNHCGLVGSPADIRNAWSSYRGNRELLALNNKLRPGKFPIKFLGVFDTVGALGVPAFPWDDKRYQFHDTTLNPNIKHAYHAIAMDEVCPDFPACTWSNPKTETHEQRWFAGSHGDIGGGVYKDRSATNIPLRWILDKAIVAGMQVHPEVMIALDDEIEKAGSEIKVHSGYWDLGGGLYGLIYLGRKLHRGILSAPGAEVDLSVKGISGYKTEAVMCSKSKNSYLFGLIGPTTKDSN